MRDSTARKARLPSFAERMGIIFVIGQPRFQIGRIRANDLSVKFTRQIENLTHHRESKVVAESAETPGLPFALG
jgi:hypothetical protein